MNTFDTSIDSVRYIQGDVESFREFIKDEMPDNTDLVNSFNLEEIIKYLKSKTSLFTDILHTNKTIIALEN